jgi:hypothetical protein
MRYLLVALSCLLTVGMVVFPSRHDLLNRIEQRSSTTQSDAEKIKQLRLEQSTAQLSVNYWHRQLRPYALSNNPPKAMLDSLGLARVRLDLANRAVNRFMGCSS